MAKLGERMYDAHDSVTGIKQVHFPELSNEVMKLLEMRMDELLGTLGGQLMGCGRPTRSAGMFSFLCAADSASKAGNLLGHPLSVTSSSEWSEGVRAICDELRRGGRHSLNRSVRSCARHSMTMKKSFECQSTPTRPASV